MINITKYKNNDPLNQESMNRPLQQIESAINGLESKVDNFVQTEALVSHNIPCASDVNIGDFVYFNNGILNKAIALWSNQYDSQGELLAAESSYPVGVVISKTTDTVADIVTEGVVTAPNVITAVFGSAPVAGEYYLSGTEAGKVTATRAYMPIRVCVLANANTMVVDIKQPPTNYHTHRYLTLTKGWTAVADATITEDIPTGFEDGFIYNLSEDQNLQDIMYDWAGDFLLVNDGKIVVDGSMIITAENIYSQIAPTGVVTIFTTIPCAHDEPVVRAIKTLSKRVVATNDRGIVTLEIDNYIDEGTVSNHATAITDLTSNGEIIRTPVISELRSDNTISIVSGGNGIAYISTAGVTRTLYPEVVNLNNATTTSIDSKLMYVFPAGRESGLVGVFHLNTLAEGLQYRVYPFIEPVGASGTFSANFNAAVSFVKQGNATGITDYEVCPMNQSLAGTIAAATKYFIQGTTALTADGAGTVYLNLTTSPSVSNLLLGFGIIVQVEEKP